MRKQTLCTGASSTLQSRCHLGSIKIWCLFKKQSKLKFKQDFWRTINELKLTKALKLLGLICLAIYVINNFSYRKVWTFVEYKLQLQHIFKDFTVCTTDFWCWLHSFIKQYYGWLYSDCSILWLILDDEDNMTEWVPSDVEDEEETNMAGEPR